MSWKLLKSTGEVYYLLPTSTCKIGRQGCQILIPDTTVSRHHASIDVSFDRVDEFSPACSTVKLKDVSKFVQTSVNGTLLTQSNRLVTLHTDDVLSFGACTDTFILKWDPYILMVTEESQVESLKQQALNAGVLLSRSPHESAKGIIMRDSLRDFSNHHIMVRAYLDRIIPVKSSILSVLINYPSGSTDLPPVENHAFPIPNPHVDRYHLFQDCSFIVQSESSFSEILRDCGANVITTLKGSVSDVYVIQIDGIEPATEYIIERARVATLQEVFDAVWQGDVGMIARIQPSDIFPKKPDSENTQATSWITKAEEVRVHEKRMKHNLTDENPTPVLRASKKFKKARIIGVVDTKVPLCDWNGSAKLNRSTEQNVSFNRERDEVDAWMRSTISQ